jgi:hypothetical protein
LPSMMPTFSEGRNGFNTLTSEIFSFYACVVQTKSMQVNK